MGYGSNGGGVSVGVPVSEFNAYKAETATEVSVVGGIPSAIWQPPLQPSADDINPNNTDLNSFMALWEGLRNSFPEYISRELLGKDQTGVYDIYKYIFEPEQSYEKTIIIDANIHGTETTGQKILYRMMYHICNSYKTYSQLNYLRNKVRFIIIPVANPAGLVAGTRYNGNNVDLNRNFEYGWNQFVSGDNTYKGTAPLSEKETQYLDAIMNQYASEGAVSYINIHDTVSGSTPDIDTAIYYAPVPQNGLTARNFINEVIESVAPVGLTIIKNVEQNREPITSNQAANIYNLHACGVEWIPGGIYGITSNSAEDMTEGLKFIGNIITRLATIEKSQITSLRQPWVVELGGSDTSLATSTIGEWEDIPQTEFTFTPAVDGILIINAELCYQNASTGSLNYMVPVIVQSGHSALGDTSFNQQKEFNEVYSEPGGKRDILSSSRTVSVFAKDNYNYGDVTIKLKWMCTSGAMAHRRSRLHITFMPSDMGNKYSQYISNAGSGYQMIKAYPASVT